MRTRVTLALSTAALSVVLLQATQQQPFRAAVTVVRLDVSVLDDPRRPIRGLGLEDFTVIVDGVEQRLVDVSEMDHVARTGGTAFAPPAPPGFVSNQSAPTRRAFALILDDALSSNLFMVKSAQTAARAFMEGLQPEDLVSVTYTWIGTHNQEFTTDRARLYDAIDRFQPGPRSQFVIEAMLRTLRDAVRVLNATPGIRGAVVFVSPGPPVVTKWEAGLVDEAQALSAGEVLFGSDLTSVVGEAGYARVPIYSLSSRGLVAPGPGSRPWRQVTQARFANDFLTSVANSSGGRAFVDTNDLLPGVEQVLLENNSRYVVAYEPTYPADDGRYRRIEIEVDRPDAQVSPSGRMLRSPRRADEEAGLSPRTAIAGVLPLGGIPMAVRATVSDAVSGSDTRATIELTIGPATGPPSDANVECVAFDTARLREAGAVSGRARVGGSGEASLRLELLLERGRYNLRCGIHVPSTGRLGSVYTQITLPGSRFAAACGWSLRPRGQPPVRAPCRVPRADVPSGRLAADTADAG